ncbi:Six-hairpin glycosidase-like protein [Thelonectria olida]|uniref:Six-hairpin glycosidase-like protein n=1 Tax=Thelonectria olida TaxID=1576542 RepID=A0A9P9AQS1_9HYPO|nr:Six-hairpin glycosidase-like protein [Thelonectria olida]
MPQRDLEIPDPTRRLDVSDCWTITIPGDIATPPDDSASPLTPDEQSNKSDTSWSDGHPDSKDPDALRHRPSLHSHLSELYLENIVAKPCRAAAKYLQQFDRPTTNVLGQPVAFPEIVLQTGTRYGQWQLREPEFWTCGFFPGTLYALLERGIKYPSSMGVGGGAGTKITDIRSHLRRLCQAWSEPLHSMATRTDTHDIGFIVMPALQREWELFGNQRSLESIIQAAHSLATRYVPTAGAIRSWDCLLKKDIAVTDMQDNLLIIIDSMCNLDLLFYAAAHIGTNQLAAIAATHARTLLKTHLRPESERSQAKNGYKGQLYSTCHVANIVPQTGHVKWQWTAQGYSNDSTWSRGQAWAILGYAQTYHWTRDGTFLDAACGVAEYFLHRLDSAPACVEVPAKSTTGIGKGKRSRGRYVPLWDFDAPIQDKSEPLRDSSAGVIAANGMLLLSQILTSLNQHTLSRRFFEAAIDIVKDTLELSLADEKARFGRDENETSTSIYVEDVVVGQTFEAILKHGTANNNENARRRYCNHGLVYGDYYLVEFGNRLLSMGFI